jgi:transposase
MANGENGRGRHQNREWSVMTGLSAPDERQDYVGGVKPDELADAVLTGVADRGTAQLLEAEKSHLAEFRGVLQVDGYGGFKGLLANRPPGEIRLAFCWAHCRRRFYDIHQETGSPLAEEALRRIGELYKVEAEVRGRPADERRAVRQERSKPIVDALHAWLTVQLGRVSGKSGLAEAIRYALRHWQGLVLFLEDGRLELDTNTVERTMRGVALGRKNSLFAGSDGGARCWAVVASLVATAKLNGVEPLAWLTDVLERMVSGRTKATELERLLPWNWNAERLVNI